MMTKPDVLVCGSYPEWDEQGLEAAFTCHRLPASNDPSELPQATRAGIEGVAFKGHFKCTGTFMDALPNLKVIANFGVGYDAIDVAAASERGIAVTNTPDVLTDDVADLAAAMLVMRARDLFGAETWLRSGNWARNGDYPLQSRASGRKAGVVGLGRIGRAIATRLAAFDMEIHYHSRQPKPDTDGWTYHADPVALATEVDHLVIALAGGPDTENYVSKQAIEALGPQGILVNISRGSTVDEAALLDALETGKIAGAALDVFLNEPRIDSRFLMLKNATLLPHVGSATTETRAAMGQLQRDNLSAHFAGKPLLTQVN